MPPVVAVAIGIVALLHVGFLVLEMFLWTTPFGRRTFRLSDALAQGSAPLAKNQGLYNGFLAAGLVWGMLPGPCAHQVQVFFLTCVIVAGVFGGLTAQRSILWVQALPGAIALALVFLVR